MSHGVRVICRPEVSTGFALAGLQAIPIERQAEAGDLLLRMRAQGDVGVVLIEQSIYDAIPADLRRELGKRPLPMLVPFAGPTWEKVSDEGDRYIVAMLRQAVGYRVRFR